VGGWAVSRFGRVLSVWSGLRSKPPFEPVLSIAFSGPGLALGPPSAHLNPARDPYFPERLLEEGLPSKLRALL
jgi:hypothetical protein